MRTHLGTAALGIAATLLVWAITEWLDLFPLPWSVVTGVVAGLLVAGLALLILRRRDPASRRIATGIRAGGNVRIHDVTATTNRTEIGSSDTASDVRARGDVDISSIQDGSR